MATATKTKPKAKLDYECSICGRKFTTDRGLKVHRGSCTPRKAKARKKEAAEKARWQSRRNNPVENVMEHIGFLITQRKVMDAANGFGKGPNGYLSYLWEKASSEDFIRFCEAIIKRAEWYYGKERLAKDFPQDAQDTILEIYGAIPAPETMVT